MSNCRTGNRAESGFSLIELMVTLAVAAILLSLALPSFTDAMTRSRIATVSNEFIAAVMYARSEALQRNSIGGICASTNKTACAGEWSDGWIVWADIDRDGVLGAGEVLRIGTVSPKDSMTTPTVTAIEFGARGMPTVGVTSASEPVFAIEPDDCDAGEQMRRELTVTFTGQVRMVSTSCT